MRQFRKSVIISGAVLLSVLCGCSGKKEQELQTAEDVCPQEQAEVTGLNDENPFNETELTDDWGGDGTLPDFIRWMKDNRPGAKAAVMRVGKQDNVTGGGRFWETVESDGYFPFIPEETDFDSFTELKNGENTGNLWCVIPLDPLSRVTVTGADGLFGEKPEETAVALFYLSDREAVNGVQVDIISDEDGRTVTFLLNESLNNLPMNASVENMTVEDEKQPAALWRLYGWWTEEAEPDAAVKPGRKIWFSPDGRFAAFKGTGSDKTDCEEGSYTLENGRLMIEMDGKDSPSAVSLELKDGKLRMKTGFLKDENADGVLTFSGHRYFQPRGAGSPSYYAPVKLAAAYGKTETGKDNLIFEVTNVLQSGLLVRGFTEENRYRGSDVWWVINTGGPCYDYLSGKDLSLKGMRQNLKNGFVSASLKDGKEVFVCFEDSPLLKAYLPEAETGKEYEVTGLGDRVLSIRVEYARLDVTPFLLIEEGDGSGSVCDLMKMTKDGKFTARKIPVEESVIEFETGELPGGEAGPAPAIFAQLESGRLIDALSGEDADFSAEAYRSYFNPETFMEEIQPVLQCLQSCDRELFGAEVDQSRVFLAGMERKADGLAPGILYESGTPLPEGFEEDPACVEYYPVKNFHTNDEVRQYLSRFFSADVIQQVFHNDFLEFDGKLYLKRGGRGYGTVVCQPDTAEYLWEDSGRQAVKIDYSAFGEYDHSSQILLMYTGEGWKIVSIVQPGAAQG